MIASAAVAFPVDVSAQATITVSPSGTYKTIQSAVNAASAGDIILVQSGTYNENVVLDKAVTLKAAPVPRPSWTRVAKYPAFRVKAARRMDGFTVRNSGSSPTAASTSPPAAPRSPTTRSAAVAGASS